MSGMGVGVLLKTALDAEQLDALGVWLHSVGRVERVRTNEMPDPIFGSLTWSITIEHGPAIGMYPFDSAYHAEATCPISIALLDQEDGLLCLYEAEEKARLIAAIGYMPQMEMHLSTGLRERINQDLLGHLTLAVMERYPSVVDIGAQWFPPMQLDWLSAEEAGAHWVDSGRLPFVYTGPGHAYQVGYAEQTTSDCWRYTNLLDLEAFRFRIRAGEYWFS